MRCPYCDKSIWVKMEARDNGVTVVLPLTVDEVADKLVNGNKK